MCFKFKKNVGKKQFTKYQSLVTKSSNFFNRYFLLYCIEQCSLLITYKNISITTQFRMLNKHIQIPSVSQWLIQRPFSTMAPTQSKYLLLYHRLTSIQLLGSESKFFQPNHILIIYLIAYINQMQKSCSPEINIWKDFVEMTEN